MKIGSHVGMSGKEMMLGSVKEALSYCANTFMLYTGAPQNTQHVQPSMLSRWAIAIFSSRVKPLALVSFLNAIPP